MSWSVKKIAIVAIAATLFVSTLLAIGISELIIRKLYPQNTYNIAKTGSVSVFKKSDLIPFELKSNGQSHHIAPTHEFSNDITTNSLGYRGPEFPKEKPTDTMRILMLGDSTTFGIGSNDDQTFAVLLEQQLKDQGKKVQVINAGFASGLSPDTYYLYLKEKGLKLQPDIVFINLFLGNDITDLFENDWPKIDSQGLPLRVTSKEREIDSAGRLVFRQMDWKYRIPIIRNMHTGILTFNVIEQKSPKLEKIIRWLVGAPDLLEDIPQTEKDKCLYFNECSERFEQQWQRLDRIFSGLYELATTTSTQVIITLMPAPFQLSARPDREEADNKLSVTIPDGNETNQNYPQKHLIEMLNQHQLQYFDLLQALRENLDPQISNDYVYKDDGHFTPKGNQAISEAYSKYLGNFFNSN